ncbi:CHAP domain-containing protein [Proteiniphilum sp. X52]|uniref:CHAP domain-containing protein n=1 Tax=Proteiniphilum sp. X52 TaxID=2382159 RepID=UPI00351A8626
MRIKYECNNNGFLPRGIRKNKQQIVGDVAIFNSYSHIGIVIDVDGDYVIVVHGNSGKDNVKSSRMHKSNFTFRTR